MKRKVHIQLDSVHSSGYMAALKSNKKYFLVKQKAWLNTGNLFL